MAARKLTERWTGTWSGSSTLFLDPAGAGERSDSRLSVRSAALGRFVTLEYDWSTQGARQEGLLLIGAETPLVAAAAWVDSWHMAERLMKLAGTIDPRGSVRVVGRYAATPGVEWGWSITVELASPDELLLRMHNIEPSGREALAVDARYRREA